MHKHLPRDLISKNRPRVNKYKSQPLNINSRIKKVDTANNIIANTCKPTQTNLKLVETPQKLTTTATATQHKTGVTAANSDDYSGLQHLICPTAACRRLQLRFRRYRKIKYTLSRDT